MIFMAMPGRVGSLKAFIEANSVNAGRPMLFPPSTAFCTKYKDFKAASELKVVYGVASHRELLTI
jgi:hypothetical protein